MTPNALASGRRNGYGDGVAGVTFDSRPTRTLKADVTVMLERTRDELPAIQQIQRSLLRASPGEPDSPGDKPLLLKGEPSCENFFRLADSARKGLQNR